MCDGQPVARTALSEPLLNQVIWSTTERPWGALQTPRGCQNSVLLDIAHILQLQHPPATFISSSVSAIDPDAAEASAIAVGGDLAPG